tara:strand:- start:3041 stop:3391 length:351 start_codon:yes stop_codon:yes gene_type:complete
MKKDEKKDDKHALVIVVGTGGPKKPEKTADPSMKKAWSFLKNSEEYRRERDRKELGLGPDADTSIPKEGTLTETLDSKTGTPRTITPQKTQVPSGQLEARRNIARNPTNEIEYQRD